MYGIGIHQIVHSLSRVARVTSLYCNLLRWAIHYIPIVTENVSNTARIAEHDGITRGREPLRMEVEWRAKSAENAVNNYLR